LKVEQMSLPDLPQIELLVKQLGYAVTKDEIVQRYSSIALKPEYALFVAKKLDKVLGWIQVNKGPSSMINSDYAEVGALVVDQEHRGLGIGKLLLREAEVWAKQNGLKRIRLLSNTTRTDAHRFYDREGYQVAKISKVFLKALE
jgi:GNAT superfamily N-acetyltransferase